MSLLAGADATTLSAVKDAVTALRARMRPTGPRIVMVTSLVVEDTPEDAVELLVATGSGFYRLRTPRIDIAVNGAGDLIAALLLFHVIDTNDPALAFARAASSVWGIIERTAALSTAELALVAGQDQLLQPVRIFNPQAC